MKNRRTLILFLVLILCVGAYSIFTYVIEPMENLLEIQRQTYFNTFEKYNEVKTGLLTEEILNKKIENFKRKMKQLDYALPNQIYQEEVILYLKEKIEKNEMTVENISFTFEDLVDPTVEENKETLDLENSAYAKELGATLQIDITNIENVLMNEETVDHKENDPLSYMTMNIDFKSSYLQMKNFVDDIENFKSKAIVKNISITKVTGEITLVSGSMEIAMPYYVDDEGKLKNIELEIDEEIGNTQPFIYRDLYSQADPTLPNPQPRMIADFGIELNTVSSDASVASINKSPLRYTTLYVDNPIVEEMNLWIKKEGGDLYYRYGTSYDTYPAGEDEYEQFVKFNNQLVMNVYSVRRKIVSDQAGVNLNVYNSSGVELIINTYDDDETNPRFRATSHEGHFIVKRY